MSAIVTMTHGELRWEIFTRSECPICHKSVHISDYQYQYVKPDRKKGYAVFHCPNPNCDSIFLGEYILNPKGTGQLNWLVPTRPVIDEVSDTIKYISPGFVTIYEEAITAKDMGLSQICGAGFRKAFEFLIKDYAKHCASDESQKKEIENKFAGTVVNDFIPDKRIQTVAKRALWIGNDETHYLRKWENKDIEDMITLIRLTIYFIEIDYLSRKYEEEMPG